MKTRVGVLRGGISSEYPVSLQTGKAVLKNLPPHYKPVDILIDKDGQWHLNGWAQSPHEIFTRVDVIFNALHGYYGEDGKVQKLLEQHNMPYTGSDSFSSALGMNKSLSKKRFEEAGLKTPYYKIVGGGENIAQVYRAFPQPSIVKPISGGSSIGVTIAENYRAFAHAINEALRYSPKVIIEEYIKGREGTCGIIQRYRGEELYVLPPIEIVAPAENRFFDYESKYNGASRELCPAPFSLQEKKEIMSMARRAHQALGLRHYSRSDFIISPRGVYILEINTLPGLTEESLMPKACAVVGCSFPDLLDHLLFLALRGD